MAGAYTDQRLNLSRPWEGLRKKCQGFKPDPVWSSKEPEEQSKFPEQNV